MCRLAGAGPRRLPLRLVVAIVLAAMLAGAVIAAAFGDDDGSLPDVVVEWLGTAEATETPGGPASPPAQLRATPTRTVVPDEVTGFAYPIAGGCLPESDALMPGAERAYRNGQHEGVDFYDSDNCAEVGVDSEVLAAKSGTVTRADWDYVDLTAETLSVLEERIAGGDAANPEIEDAFRGRQVWIGHADGTVTRYAHLNGIAEGIDVGVKVDVGQLIAYVGDSGTPESVTNPGTEYHLHFEIRVGEAYLGQGSSAERIRELYQQAFAP